jgi:tetratricopeptide (TPR) repeat protein
MMKYLLFVFCALTACLPGLNAMAQKNNNVKDSTYVMKLNKQALDQRFANPGQTVQGANKALILAIKLGYKKGIGESYRVMGIGNFYLTQPIKAIDNYLAALNYFTEINDLKSEAKVYNNIGNLYRDNDYDQAIDFFEKSLKIATKLSDNQLIASLYLNMGNVYNNKKDFNKALSYYNKSNAMFVVLKDSVNLIQCMQNKGVIYFALEQYDKSEALLIEARKEARQIDLTETAARIDLTIAELYMVENKFDKADKTIKEGLLLSGIVKSEKTTSDFKHTSYLLQLKKKDYKSALGFLTDLYHQDSVRYKENAATQITVIRDAATQQARLNRANLLLKDQEYERVRFWSLVIVAGLLLILVGVLVNNVKRKSKTNAQLTNLNAEVSRQKDNLDRINHHLEEIIDERTKDLQVKNKKLSEYSSYLSHQIRGPIATLKGLMNLEKEGLVDQPECIRMMNKCVSEIDDKIIEMSDMLHDPARAGF